MDSTNKNGDDHFSIVSGDLGLGESSRSNSFLNFELLNIGHGHSCLSVSDSCLHTHLSGLPCSSSLHPNTAANDSDSNIFVKKSMFCDGSCQTLLKQDAALKTSACNIDARDSETDIENFPTYADVPYGTSLRQQKKLFEQQIDNLRRQNAACLLEDNTKAGFKFHNWNFNRSNSLKLTAKEIDNKLTVALQEMDELKIELDACQKRLDAKYKAVTILKQQADLADMEMKQIERKASETKKCLEQEVSKLQFEMEWRESTFMNSQQTWAERFDRRVLKISWTQKTTNKFILQEFNTGGLGKHGDGMEALVEALDDRGDEQISEEVQKLDLDRVCQENAILMSKLEARNEELRRANAHKSAISRERDELLALLDITERLKYEQGKSMVAEEEYSTFSSSELAVLGACKCRVSSPEPCGCAHAAANLRKEVSKLKEELELNQKRRLESNLAVDAYRTAFEEQLSKSRSLSLRFSQMATLSSRTAKAKAAIKWLIQVLNDDDYMPPKPTEQGMEAEKGNNLPNMSLQELVTVLTEMVHEKNEALAHQKLAAQVLSNKLYFYENKEGKRSELSGVSTEPKTHRHKKKQNKEPQLLLQCRNSEPCDGTT